MRWVVLVVGLLGCEPTFSSEDDCVEECGRWGKQCDDEDAGACDELCLDNGEDTARDCHYCFQCLNTTRYSKDELCDEPADWRIPPGHECESACEECR